MELLSIHGLVNARTELSVLEYSIKLDIIKMQSVRLHRKHKII